MFMGNKSIPNSMFINPGPGDPCLCWCLFQP
uniref:Uncharacterized protein n=1 Tax=Anguilla anguilla TaxID=7936 RepID=A0A0E9XX37_ANGAN